MVVTNIDQIEPLQGQNVGFVIGVLRKGEPLTGTVNGTNKVFTIDSDKLPIYDRECDGPPVDEKDITVYDDGVEVDIDSIDLEKGEITLKNAPLAGSVMTVDFYEEFEPYICQVVDVDAKYDETTYGRIRSAVKKKLYGAREVTISAELLTGDLSSISIFFDQSTGEMLSEPPEVEAYVVLEKGSTAVGRMYFKSCRVVPKKLVSAKEGDTVGTDLEFTVDENPILWNPEALPIPTADFTADVTSGDAPLEVNFTNKSGGTITSYLWDFGDGSADVTTENPTHTYSSAGQYTVVLQVSNSSGSDVKTKVNYITVTESGP